MEQLIYFNKFKILTYVCLQQIICIIILCMINKMNQNYVPKVDVYQDQLTLSIY